ncbi:SDR family oxidoreductase (plasmid) [Halorussus limi]|uniref:SDR family oxidoreductase n=1 Tax=Halorussus limi TaxID=2938695 RepID=A0A8U0I0K4_9EURY|nr:SDR family oxidoreductase [Halorussus limi]UPV76942.1 SDR family oxidoreductase [Halorussus limi]
MGDLLTDRVAVVTGGSSGIGRSIARAFAEHGADVVVADVRETPREGGAPTHELLEDETDANAAFVECDVTDVEDIESAMSAADEFGGIDVMVNNAGIFRLEEFLDVTPGEYDRLMDVNVKGMFFGAQRAAARMLEHDGGSIINVSSIAGIVGNGRYVTYCTSKGAVRLLTYALAHSLGPEGIRVNAIHPGGVETAMSEDANLGPEATEAFVEMIPQRRMGQPEDIAGAALFLASDLASYVTGESLVVDGGYTYTG